MDHARRGDKELMALVVEQQAAALEVLYDRYAGPAFSLAVRILGDRGAAEEVVQDTFVAVWRKAGTYDARYGKPHSWILRIARNRAIDELRRRKASGGAQWRILDELPDPADRDSDTTLASELRFTLGGALEDLPSDQRKVVEMAYLAGLSQREIANRTGIPLGTVKTRTRLALGKLRQVLDPNLRKLVDDNGL